MAEQILTQEVKKLNNNSETVRLTSSYVESYFKTTSHTIGAVTLEYAEDFFKEKILRLSQTHWVQATKSSSN